MGWLSDAGSFIKNNASSIVHTGLDLVGFVPVLGAIPDAANALLYAIEGDYRNALLSAAAAVPLVGDTVALARTGVKASKLVKAGKAVKGVKTLNMLDNGKALIKSLKGKMLEGAELLKKLDIQEMFEAIKKKIKKLIGGGKCFTGDMLVLTERGYQAIQEIKAGDKVYSRDEETGETGLKRVGKITQRKSHTIYTIEINGSTIIKTTAYHPFYMEDRGWVNAINLVEGDKLSTKEGIGRITNIGKERREEPVITYNFQVEDWVSYFVSEEKVYVHNGGCGSPDVPKGASGAVDDVPQIQKNAAQGKAYEQQEFSKFANNANDAVEQITIKTPDGTKIRVDAIGIDKNTGNVVINEFKSSQTAPLTPNQKIGFPQLEAGGGTVVGKGKGVFTGGFEIPAGTKIEIIRPPK